nr:hypothetical protein [Desulfosarcina cetonica]
MGYNNFVDFTGLGVLTTRNLNVDWLSLYQQWGIFAGLLMSVSSLTACFSLPISTMPVPSRT